MEQKTKEAGSNLMDINEEKEKQNITPGPSQTPQKYLRKTKKVKYFELSSEDQDNSDDYELPEESKQKLKSKRKTKRSESAQKVNADNNNKKKNKIEKENTNKENNNNEAEKKDENNNDNKKIENNGKEKEENGDKKNNNNNFGTIINISETLPKYSNNESIPNSELILIILEICLKSSQFGIDKDNSSRAFWEEIGKKPEFKPIIDKFKPETLRKYWRTIRETKKFRKIISETKKYSKELNNPNMKLFSSIHAICEYVSNPGRKIDYYLNKHMTKPANKNKKINVNDMTPNQQIDDIVNTFMKYFPKESEKKIIEILFRNNFDIENTFLVLKDEENFEYLCFDEKEDEILKKNKEDKDDKSEEYQELINRKGLEDVLRRKEFLFNIKIDRKPYQVEEENNKETNGDKKMDVEADEKDKDKNQEKKDEEVKETTKGENKTE